jgi:alkanesulfonate monooxygenase SsuD/methylene tetrahydromethanopterin reductase-like flavin-dependent oxidoreductase (luciferase family)
VRLNGATCAPPDNAVDCGFAFLSTVDIADDVALAEGERRRMIRFLNPDGDWINLRDRIPINVAASGPKALELAGEIGDGVIRFDAVGDSLLDYALGHVLRGAARSGRKLSDLSIMLSTACHIARPDEDLASVQQAVGSYVTSQCNIFALPAHDPDDLPADVRDGIMAFRTAYRTPDAPIETRHLDLYSGYVNDFEDAHARLVTPRMIDATTLTGTAEAIKARIARLAAAGVHQIAIHGRSRALGRHYSQFRWRDHPLSAVRGTPIL